MPSWKGSFYSLTGDAVDHGIITCVPEISPKPMLLPTQLCRTWMSLQTL